jgi:hypothetical protein
MYSHRVVTVGAVVAAMIATSGDESFVMFAMIPKQALLLTVVLFGLGIAGGALTDLIMGRRKTAGIWCGESLDVHPEHSCECLPRGQVVRQWRNCSPARGILAVVLAVFMLALATGQIGPPEWTWIRITLLVTSCAALFIVSTVPDHFLEEHLWRHGVLKHAPRVFLWTLGALVAMEILTEHLHLGRMMGENSWAVLLFACLVGLIPESGPHLVFVTLYAKGAIPFGVLLANSIVQDGHGMLPMLAHSKRAFLGIKLVNLIVGFAAGGLWLLWEGF